MKRNEEGKQKVKLLLLMDMLRCVSDANNPVTTAQIISFLQSNGISCDRKTVKRDIEALRENGYSLGASFVGHKKGYFVSVRNFSKEEISMLIDAVMAANYLTEEKTQALCDQLLKMGGEELARNRQKIFTIFNTRKRSNQKTLDNQSLLREAIVQGRRVRFKIFRIDAQGTKKYYYDGKEYEIDPISLVVNNDRTYLIGLEPGKTEIHHNRIDRMEGIEILKRTSPAGLIEEKKREVPSYMKSLFSMFSGPLHNLTLGFSRAMCDVIYDQFGEEIHDQIREENDGSFSLTVKVRKSPPFFGWLAQMDGKIWIKSPLTIKEEYLAYLKKLYDSTQEK